MSGAQLQTLFLCLPPGLFWLWYVYRKSRYHPPSRVLVALACVAGAVSTGGVLMIENRVATTLPEWHRWISGDDIVARLAFFVLLVGLVEEGCKLLSVRATVYYARSFDEVVHGVVYSSAAALGFATMENARYVDIHGASVLLGRSVLSTFGHVLMSMVWGFAMGLQRTAPNHRLRGWLLLATSLGLSALIHGVYDVLLVYGQVWAALLLLLFLWRLFLDHVDETRKRSPHRVRAARPVVECASCHALSRARARFCGACGHSVEGSAPRYCSACLGATRTDQSACTACGVAMRPG